MCAVKVVVFVVTFFSYLIYTLQNLEEDVEESLSVGKAQSQQKCAQCHPAHLY